MSKYHSFAIQYGRQDVDKKLNYLFSKLKSMDRFCSLNLDTVPNVMKDVEDIIFPIHHSNILYYQIHCDLTFRQTLFFTEF